LLDAALARLATTDRDALLLKFMREKNHRDVGQALGISEEAARKRVARALDRLRDLLHRRGVACPAAATLATLLTAHATEAAPAHALEQGFAAADEDNPLTLAPETTLRITVLDPAGKPVPGLRLTPAAVLVRGPGLNFVAYLPPEIARELARQTDADGVATL